MQTDGSAIIVKSDDKKFGMLLNRAGMEQGDWLCCSGEADAGGSAAAFTAMADVSPGDEIITEKNARITCWNNHCDGVYSTGYCFSAPRRKWNRMVDAYARAVGEIAADKVGVDRAELNIVARRVDFLGRTRTQDGDVNGGADPAAANGNGAPQSEADEDGMPW